MISGADVRDFSAINRALYGEHGASIVRFDVLRSFFANTNSEGDPSTVMADPEPAAVSQARFEAAA